MDSMFHAEFFSVFITDLNRYLTTGNLSYSNIISVDDTYVTSTPKLILCIHIFIFSVDEFNVAKNDGRNNTPFEIWKG